MDLVRTCPEKQSWQSLNHHGYYAIGGGVPAHREDFQIERHTPKYAAVLAGPLRGYELKFLVQAGSTQRVDELVKEVLALKIAPDWKAAVHDGQISPSAAIPKRVRVSAQVLQSFALRKAPQYPTESRQNRVEGSVVISVRVDENGRLEDIFVEEGDPLLAQAAVKAVSQWEYKPYLLNGVPAKLESMVVVTFQIH